MKTRVGLFSMVLLVGLLTARTAHAESFAGRWHLLSYTRCVNTPANEQACRTLQSPSIFAVMGVRGGTLTVRGDGQYVSNVAGQYRVRFVTTITESVPGGHRPAHCDNTTVFTTAFSGICREVGQGHGHISLGGTGMPDFWQDDTAGSWQGQAGGRFATSGPTDTFNPVCAGTLNARQYLALFGYRSVPRGISMRIVLTHG